MGKTTELTLTQTGKTRSLRLPPELIRRYGFTDTLRAELREDGLLLRPNRIEKLSWEEAAAEMVASGEDWSEWESSASDGLGSCPWDYPIPPKVEAWARKSAERERRAKKARAKRAKS